jgi:tRNA(fMet)-specific endonuclease VapC
MILLDTDICIELLRGNKGVLKKRNECEDNVAISFMSAAELFYGAEKSKNSHNNKLLVEEFLLSIYIINTDISILRKFGEIKSTLDKEGSIIADADIFIAATALQKCNKLITGNIDHFKRINELKLDNWVR